MVLGRVVDPYSGASWIRIRLRNTDPDPHMQIKDKMEAKDVRFKIFINNSETQLIKNFFVTVCAYSLKNIGTVPVLVLKQIIFLYNYFEFFFQN